MSTYKYLGCEVNDRLDCSSEVTSLSLPAEFILIPCYQPAGNWPVSMRTCTMAPHDGRASTHMHSGSLTLLIPCGSMYLDRKPMEGRNRSGSYSKQALWHQLKRVVWCGCVTLVTSAYTRGSTAQPLMPTSSCVRDSGCPATTWTISCTRSTPVMHSVMGCST